MDIAAVVALLNVAALVTIMLAMGMQVTFAEVRDSVRPIHRVALGLIANYVLVPAVTVGLLHAFQAAPMVSVGFLILAVCPGAPVSPLATTLARGNVAWSIGIMAILAGLSAILSPALLSVLLAWVAPASALSFDYAAIVRTLMVAQLLPLSAGLAIHHWAPKVTEKVARPINLVANLMLLIVVGLILATQYEMLAAVRLRGWAGMLLLFLASFVIGWCCGGKSRAIRKAMTVTTTARNAAVGLVIVTGNFADTPAVTAVVAYALVSIIGTFLCAALLGKIAVTHAGQDGDPVPAKERAGSESYPTRYGP